MANLMDLISITIDTGGADTPDTFILGSKPIKKGKYEENSPNISAIKFFETSATYTKMYRGSGIFIVEFEGSTVKRLIPANRLIDSAIETTNKPVPGLAKALPSLNGDEA